MKPRPLINRAELRRLAFELGHQRRWQFTRISERFYRRVEFNTQLMLAKEIAAHPSRGKTLT